MRPPRLPTQRRRAAALHRVRLLLLVLPLLAPFRASAVQLISEPSFRVAAGETYEDELWLRADDTALEGRLLDDALIYTHTLEVPGTIEGDLWAWADTSFTLSGEALEQVRIVSPVVTVSGRVDRSFSAAGLTVTLHTNAVIGGDVLVAADTATLDGHIRGGVRLYANRATIAGRIDGNVRLIADDVVLVPGAFIGGDLVYSSQKDIVPGKGVTIGGELERRALPVTGPSWPRRIAAQIMYALAALLTGLIGLRFLPATAGLSVRAARLAPGRAFLLGLPALLLVPFLAATAILVPVTRPLGFILAALYGVLLYAGKLVVALALGSGLLRRRGIQGYRDAVTALAAGLLLLYFLMALPTIGVWIWILASTLGLGAQLLAVASRVAAARAARGAIAAEDPDRPEAQE